MRAVGPTGSGTVAVPADRFVNVVKLIVPPRIDASNWIKSKSGVELAWSIAARRLPGPPSARVVTVIAGAVRSSNDSRLSRRERGARDAYIVTPRWAIDGRESRRAQRWGSAGGRECDAKLVA